MVAAALLLPVGDLVRATLAWSEGLGPAGPVAVAALFVPACVLCLPGTPITLAAAFTFGFAAMLPWIVLFSNLGANAAFLCGRTLLRERVEARIRASARLAAVDRAVSTSGLRTVVLLRLSPLVPFNLLNYVLGATGVRWRDHALGTFVGMLPGNVATCYVGATLGTLAQALAGEVPMETPQLVLFTLGCLATVVVAVLVARGAKAQLDAALGTAADAAP